MQATPQTDTVSPVTVADMAAFIGVASNDALLPGILIAATDAAIRWINRDLLERDWVGIIPATGYSPVTMSPLRDIQRVHELPYTQLVEVTSVSDADGNDLTYTLESARRPARITLPDWAGLSEVTVEYTAGMATVPSAIKSAIMMIAAHIYEHRGACDAQDALVKSGASTLLQPYRVEVSL